MDIIRDVPEDWFLILSIQFVTIQKMYHRAIIKTKVIARKISRSNILLKNS